ncbi:MAG TPA: hypothetical protein VGM73_17090 [Candidatus Didemnitutus sp.]|jgi:hypothetical protein
MKTLLPLLLVWCANACLASANPDLAITPFTVGHQTFRAGDEIVIDQVLATSSALKVGDQVVVHGHYRLTSAPKASLGLMVTHLDRVNISDPTEASQHAPAIQPGGAFTLSCRITYEGALHVSFYSVSTGQSVGGVYFSPAPGSPHP